LEHNVKPLIVAKQSSFSALILPDLVKDFDGKGGRNTPAFFLYAALVLGTSSNLPFASPL
jgi:hypothetical protein